MGEAIVHVCVVQRGENHPAAYRQGLLPIFFLHRGMRVAAEWGAGGGGGGAIHTETPTVFFCTMHCHQCMCAHVSVL